MRKHPLWFIDVLIFVCFVILALFVMLVWNVWGTLTGPRK